jgi:DNA-binding NarL/FixJ family response regulator
MPRDLILMDVGLPHTNGIKAAAAILEVAPAAKIIFVSAIDDQEVTSAALNAGGQDYVLKANVGRDLISAIKRIMGTPKPIE